MFSIKAAMLAATSTILLLAGVTQADFVMVDYVPPPPVDDGIEPHERSAYFWQVDSNRTIPGHCIRAKLWDYKNDLWEADSQGVRIDGNHTDPKEIEVNWGKGEGHWTYRRDNFGGVTDHGLWDLNDVQMGKCQVAKENSQPCMIQGQHGTISYRLRCQTDWFHAPVHWREEGGRSLDPYSGELGKLFGSASIAKEFSPLFDS
ncbi:hypothetical protein PG993_000629 [Apiospora rasikravindrae]|uniref:Uncharacterized protein n=1 Tax=Apiospora rasikravindrae TaxID=990691 RepID=A0ABR1U9L8_9PEZI